MSDQELAELEDLSDEQVKAQILEIIRKDPQNPVYQGVLAHVFPPEEMKTGSAGPSSPSDPLSGLGLDADPMEVVKKLQGEPGLLRKLKLAQNELRAESQLRTLSERRAEELEKAERQLRVRLSSAGQDLDSARSSVAEISERLRACQNELEQTKQSLATSTVTYKILESNKNALEARIKALEKSGGDLGKESAAAAEKVEAARQKVSGLEQHLSEAQAEASRLRSELGEARTRAQLAEQKALAAGQSPRAELEISREELARTGQELRQTQELLEAQRAMVKRLERRSREHELGAQAELERLEGEQVEQLRENAELAMLLLKSEKRLRQERVEQRSALRYDSFRGLLGEPKEAKASSAPRGFGSNLLPAFLALVFLLALLVVGYDALRNWGLVNPRRSAALSLARPRAPTFV